MLWLGLLLEEEGLILSHARMLSLLEASLGDLCEGAVQLEYRDAPELAVVRAAVGARFGGVGYWLDTFCQGLPFTPEAEGYRLDLARCASYFSFCSVFVSTSCADWIV